MNGTCCRCTTSRPRTSSGSSTRRSRSGRSGTRVIKKVPALRGPDRREPLLRELHAHAHLVRAGGEAAVGRRDQLHDERVLRVQGRVPEGHRAHAAGDGGRRDRDPALVQRRAAPADEVGARARAERRRRDARASHPGLLDLYTMRERSGGSRGFGSRSWATCCTPAWRARSRSAWSRWARDVTLVGPPTLIPPDAPAWGVQVSYDIDGVLPKLDVCYMLRVQTRAPAPRVLPQRARVRAAVRADPRPRRAAARGSADHAPGPMNRGVEIDSDVADLPQSVIEDQVTNGIAIRMALLYLLLGGSRRGGGCDERARCCSAGARVVDPAAGTDESRPTSLVERERVAAVGKELVGPRRGGDRLRAGWSCCRGWSTCTPTCASRAGAQGDDRDRHAGRGASAATRRSRRWPTPTR